MDIFQPSSIIPFKKHIQYFQNQAILDRNITFGTRPRLPLASFRFSRFLYSIIPFEQTRCRFFVCLHGAGPICKKIKNLYRGGQANKRGALHGPLESRRISRFFHSLYIQRPNFTFFLMILFSNI